MAARGAGPDSPGETHGLRGDTGKAPTWIVEFGLQLALVLVAVVDPQPADSSSYTVPATSIPLADFALVVLTVVAVIGHFFRKSK